MIEPMEEGSVGSQVMVSGRRSPRWVLVSVVCIVLLVAAFGAMRMRMSYVPADLDVTTIQTSAAGVYRVRYTPRSVSIPINEIHTWTIHVETDDGRPVEGATITVDGDMPQHGHGLPTSPQVTKELGGGDYLVEGMKFHMPGWWVVDYTISTAGQPDTVRFNLLLR